MFFEGLWACFTCLQKVSLSMPCYVKRCQIFKSSIRICDVAVLPEGSCPPNHRGFGIGNPTEKLSLHKWPVLKFLKHVIFLRTIFRRNFPFSQPLGQNNRIIHSTIHIVNLGLSKSTFIYWHLAITNLTFQSSYYHSSHNDILLWHHFSYSYSYAIGPTFPTAMS